MTCTVNDCFKRSIENKAYVAGAEAFADHASVFDCPYPPRKNATGTLRVLWLRGFFDARSQALIDCGCPDAAE